MGITLLGHIRFCNKVTGNPTRDIVRLGLVVAYAMLFASCLYAIQNVWNFSLFVSDARTYWEYSLHLEQPYSTWWVPGYPIILAIARLLTHSWLTPLQTMQSISLICFVLAGQLLFQICEIRRLGLRPIILIRTYFKIWLTHHRMTANKQKA